MGKRGPSPTPTAVLKLRGSWRADERDGEPLPDAGLPPCPAALSAEAREVWEQITPQLQAIGVLTVIDGGPLVRYCEMFARWWKATKFLREFGETKPVFERDDDGKQLLGDDGKPILKGFISVPQVGIAADLNLAMLRIEQEFGLTPSARAGLQIPKPAENNSKARFFNKQA